MIRPPCVSYQYVLLVISSSSSHFLSRQYAFSLSNHIKRLKKGKNILAIHGLNVSNTSSDFLIQPRLRGGLGSGESIVNYFDRLLFQESLSSEQRGILLDFVNSNAVGRPRKLDPASTRYLQQVQELVGLILSMPQWQFQ